MSIMNDVKQGADLTHPKPTGGYLIGAVVAIAVLGVALWVYGKLKSVAGKATGGVTSGIESQASKQLEGFL